MNCKHCGYPDSAHRSDDACPVSWPMKYRNTRFEEETAKSVERKEILQSLKGNKEALNYIRALKEVSDGWKRLFNDAMKKPRKSDRGARYNNPLNHDRAQLP